MAIFDEIIIALLFIMLIVKTVLFYQNIHNKSFGRWFFFSQYNIYNSHNKRSEKAKRNQNLFSIIILFLLFIIMIFFIISR